MAADEVRNADAHGARRFLALYDPKGPLGGVTLGEHYEVTVARATRIARALLDDYESRERRAPADH